LLLEAKKEKSAFPLACGLVHLVVAENDYALVARNRAALGGVGASRRLG
jgi:hypothetical protein